MSRQKPAVFIDMDGVLVDFVQGLHEALRVSYDVDKYPYDRNKYDLFPDVINRAPGRSMHDLYTACHKSDFWFNLKWDRRANEILNTIERYTKDAYIATYPMQDPQAWVGKLQWIDKHMPDYRGRVLLMTAHKKLLANEHALLIDDKEDNVDQFIANGGGAFLVPQPWNSAHAKFNRDWIGELDTFLSSHF
jgi:5'(3')-deoxyribonucleotidase